MNAPGSTGLTSSPATARLVTPRFGVLTLSGLAYFVGWTMLYPVLPRFVREELGGNGLAVGLAVGSFGVTAALLRPWCGRFGDRRGRRPLLVGGMAIVSLTLLAYLVVGSVTAAIVVRLLFGVGESAAFVGVAAAIQDLAPDARRGEAASYFSVATYGGVAIGPPLGQAIYEASGYDAVWVVSALVVAVGMVLGGLAAPAGVPGRVTATLAARGRGLARWLHPASIRPGFAVGMALIGYSGFVSFGALYADERGLSSPGLVFTAYAVLIVAFRVLGAKVADRFGAVPVSVFSVCCLGGGLLLMAAIPTVVGLFAGVVFFALGMALNFPALLALVVNRAGESERGFAVASFSVFFDVGFGAGGPLVGAVVAGFDSIRAGFVAGGLGTLGSLWFLRAVNSTPRTATVPADATRDLPQRPTPRG